MVSRFGNRPGDVGHGEVDSVLDRRARWVALAAALWMVAILVLGQVVPSGVVLVSFLTLSPVAVSGSFDGKVTAAYGVAALAFSSLPALWHDHWWSAQQWVRFANIALLSVAAVVIAELRVRRERRFARVANIAQVAQKVILPTLPRTAQGVTVAARYLSAARDAVIGGDLYDASVTEGYTRFIVGDVRGKGVAAIEQAARVIRAFRQSAPTQEKMADVVRDMNAYLTPFFSEEEFVTALLVDLTTPDEVTLVSCGHPPALYVSADGTARLLEIPPGLPLGIGADPEPWTMPWNPGDRLLLYTDGMSEARDRTGEFLPMLDQAPIVARGTVEEAVDGVLAALLRYVPGSHLGDDLAVVLLEHTAQPTASGTGRGPNIALRRP